MAVDVEQQCIRLAWSAAERRCEAAFDEWDTHSHLSGWADSARRMLHAVQASQMVGRGSLAAAVKEADDIRSHIEQWPAKVGEIAEQPHSALTATSLNLIGLRAGRPRRAAAAAASMDHHQPRSPGRLSRQRSSGEGEEDGGLVVGVQAALLLNQSLTMLLLAGVELSDEASAYALWAGLMARSSHSPLRLVIGFNAMSRSSARRWAASLHTLSSGVPDGGLELLDHTGARLHSVSEVEEELSSCKSDWVEQKLFTALLQSAASVLLQESDAGLDPGGGGGSKFAAQPKDMVFDDETTFKDGIYGLYKRRGLDPDRLLRSIEQEFVQNDGGRWLPEFNYVTHAAAKEQYPASKGVAPSEAERAAYTRDLSHDGYSLEDFFLRQPGRGTKAE